MLLDLLVFERQVFIVATGEEGSGVMPMGMRLVIGVEPNQVAPRHHQFYGAS